MNPSGGSPAVSLPVRFARWAVLGLGVGALGLTIVGFAGRLWWVFDLVANFRPQVLVLTVVAGAAAFAVRLVPLGGALTVGALLNLVAVWPYLVGVPVPPPSAAETLSIVSFNVGVSNPQRSEVMSFLAAEDPDLIVLLESSFEWEAAATSAGLPLRKVSVVPPTYVSGITVLAKPEVGASLLGVPFNPDEGVAVRVGVDGAFIDVLAIHPPSPTTAGRAARRDQVLSEAGTWVMGRSLPAILIGDFNATPWSHAYRAVRRSTGLSDSLEARGIQPTWPSWAGPMMIPIDHALHTDDLAVAARSTGPALGSAHRPLLVEFGSARSGD